MENMHTDVRLKVYTQCLKIDSKNWSLQCVNKLITHRTMIEMMIMFPEGIQCTVSKTKKIMCFEVFYQSFALQSPPLPFQKRSPLKGVGLLM